jgi:hypothetical protein
MDPNETLRRMRAAYAALLSDNVSRKEADDAAEALADAAMALDGWMTRGGFLPLDWTAKAPDADSADSTVGPRGLDGRGLDRRARRLAVNPPELGRTVRLLPIVNVGYGARIALVVGHGTVDPRHFPVPAELDAYPVVLVHSGAVVEAWSLTMIEPAGDQS